MPEYTIPLGFSNMRSRTLCRGIITTWVVRPVRWLRRRSDRVHRGHSPRRSRNRRPDRVPEQPGGGAVRGGSEPEPLPISRTRAAMFGTPRDAPRYSFFFANDPGRQSRDAVFDPIEENQRGLAWDAIVRQDNVEAFAAPHGRFQTARTVEMGYDDGGFDDGGFDGGVSIGLFARGPLAVCSSNQASHWPPMSDGS